MVYRSIIVLLFVGCCVIQTCVSAGMQKMEKPFSASIYASNDTLSPKFVKDSISITDTILVTKENARKLFLSNNLMLLAARYHLTSSEADLIAAKLFPNPQLSFNASFIDLSKKPIDYGASQQSYRLDQLIELGGKRGKRIDVATHSVEGAKADFQNTLYQLLNDVKESYLAAAFAQKLFETADSSYDVFKQSVDAGRLRYKSGDISEAELKKLELAQLDMLESLSDAKQTLTDARSNFRQMLNLPPDVPLVIRYDCQPVMKLPQIDSLTSIALANRADLASQREKILMEKSRIDLAHSYIIPDLTLGVELDRQGPEFKNTWGGGIGITIPIFNHNQDDLERAEAESHAAEAEEKAKINAILNDVLSAFEKYKDSWEIVQSFSLSTLENASQVRMMAVKNYNTGNIGLIDFLETQRIYNDAVQSYYNALKKLSDNQVELERALGKEIFEESQQ
jgi:cobalt-zinc-cadmium efflux system outer membrane protein